MNKLTLLGTIGAISVLAGCGQVNTGEAGFFTTWGEITSKEPLSDGLHFYCPIWTSLITYNIKNQTQQFDTEVFTKDIQSMKLKLSVTYSLEKAKIMELHGKTGVHYSQILIQPSVLGATKDAIGKLEADVIVSQREIVTKTIEETIKESLKPFGINIAFVKLINIDYSDAFERAVEEKQVALQKSIKEKNETARLKEVANQAVVKAEAEAKSRLLNSEAEAKAILIKAESEAKAIKMKNEALADSPKLIEFTLAQKWDGKLPEQMLGSTPVPFIDIMPKASK